MLIKSTLGSRGTWLLKLTPFLAVLLLIITGCDNGLMNSNDNSSDSFTTTDMLTDASKNGPANCENQVNNNVKKLLDCVTLDGVRAHQAAFQEIADANNGQRASGLPGYDASVDYVKEQLMDAGYDVFEQEFQFDAFLPTSPATLTQTAPTSVTYTQGSDFDILTFSSSGNVTAPVTAVDLVFGPGNGSTSGCEASDFAGFPAGSIALMQRGACLFSVKAENAAAAGALGAIIFNQGNIPERTGLLNGTLTSNYSGGIPVIGSTYARGEEWAMTPGLILSMDVNVFNGLATTRNLFAELPGKNPNNVVMAGAHLDGVLAGPGINDNGSGSGAILETAIQMAKVKPQNTVRFAWWGAEEVGLIGSNHYVNTLTNDEFQKIALYLNFDMIGSPNHVNFIYDGDGSEGFAPAGPIGSLIIEDIFRSFYDSRGIPYKYVTPLIGSDQQAFFLSGIPIGGLFTGASGIKSPEEAAIWGGTAGDQYDPCYHLACDTFDNVSLEALEINSDAVAYAVLNFAMNTTLINGEKAKGNFKAKHEHDETE